MSNVSIIDASAILAYLQQEKGHEAVEAALDAGPAWVTTVNYCEVLSKLCERGMPADEAHIAVNDLGLTAIDFDVELARHAAAMRTRTMPIGASLGDRACLALAERTARTQAAPTVYTAERSWTRLKWPFKIVLIRPARSATWPAVPPAYPAGQDLPHVAPAPTQLASSRRTPQPTTPAGHSIRNLRSATRNSPSCGRPPLDRL